MTKFGRVWPFRWWPRLDAAVSRPSTMSSILPEWCPHAVTHARNHTLRQRTCPISDCQRARRLLGGGIGRTRRDVLNIGRDASHPLADLRDLGGKPLGHAEHLPMQTADRGENQQQQGAIESTAVHAAQPITAGKSSSTDRVHPTVRGQAFDRQKNVTLGADRPLGYIFYPKKQTKRAIYGFGYIFRAGRVGTIAHAQAASSPENLLTPA